MERAHASLSCSVYPARPNLQNTQVTLFSIIFNSLHGLDLQLTFPLRIFCVIFFQWFVFSLLSFLGYLHFRRQDSLPALAHRISNMEQPPCLGKLSSLRQKGEVGLPWWRQVQQGLKWVFLRLSLLPGSPVFPQYNSKFILKSPNKLFFSKLTWHSCFYTRILSGTIF